MDTGLCNGIYSTPSSGVLIGNESALNYGMSNGVLNENILENSIVTDGLQLYYDPKNAYSSPYSGTVLRDLSPNKFDGQILNGAYLDYSNRRSISLDGTNQYIDCGSSSAGSDSSSFTVCAWVYPIQGSGDYPICRGNDGFGSGWSIFLRELFSVVQNISGIPTQYSTASSPLRYNRWNFYCGVYAPGEGKLYHYWNGMIRSTVNCGVGAPLRSSTRGWIFGLVSSSGTYWKGNIGTVIVYNKVLTACEVFQNYNATKQRFGL